MSLRIRQAGRSAGILSGRSAGRQLWRIAYSTKKSRSNGSAGISKTRPTDTRASMRILRTDERRKSISSAGTSCGRRKSTGFPSRCRSALSEWSTRSRTKMSILYDTDGLPPEKKPPRSAIILSQLTQAQAYRDAQGYGLALCSLY